MKKQVLIVVVITVFSAFGALGQDILINEEGVTCNIPDGFNNAPYSTDYNLKGMEEFCDFPHEAVIANFLKVIARLKETGLVHPICVDVDFGPPPTCYKLINE